MELLTHPAAPYSGYSSNSSFTCCTSCCSCFPPHFDGFVEAACGQQVACRVIGHVAHVHRVARQHSHHLGAAHVVHIHLHAGGTHTPHRSMWYTYTCAHMQGGHAPHQGGSRGHTYTWAQVQGIHMHLKTSGWCTFTSRQYGGCSQMQSIAGAVAVKWMQSDAVNSRSSSGHVDAVRQSKGYTISKYVKLDRNAWENWR